MKMTAAVLYELGLPQPFAISTPFRIEEIELEGPGDGEVLVEVRAAGLCHSDLSTVMGLSTRPLPAVGGHEGAGIVREVGAGVRHIRPGDHVVMTVASGCGHCPHCDEARPVLCDNVEVGRAGGSLANGGRRLSVQGRPVYHYSGVSSFAQYAVTMADSLIVIDPTIPLDVAAIFGCAVITGAGAVFNAAQLRVGQNVAVIGLGGVGLNSVMAAKVAGAKEIIGIDLNTDKFPLAMELGCTRTHHAMDADLVEAVLDLTHGGVDAVFEVSGNAKAVLTAEAITRRGGTVICVGVGAANALYQYPHNKLVTGEKVLRGSVLGSGMPQHEIPRYIDLYRRGKMPVDRLRSTTMGFDAMNLALDRLEKGEMFRQVLLPHGV